MVNGPRGANVVHGRLEDYRISKERHRFELNLLKLLLHTIYNPNVHSDRAEDKYIGATVKYFDIPLSSALNYLYYSLLIDRVDSRISNLTYFQIYS